MWGYIAKHYKEEQIDIVIGPVTVGIILSYEMTSQLNIISIFTERINGSMALRRNFEIKYGQRVLIMEDVLTTGSSVIEVIDLVEAQD